MASVKLTNVKKIYNGNVTAVHDFNLDIKDKEFVVFVGPSGCGKSTTLRMIAGLEDISDGTVEIDGEVVNDYQPKDRHICMVFQNYALYPHLTVFENMAFPLRIAKVPYTVPKTDEEKEQCKRDIEACKQDIAELEAKIKDEALLAENREELALRLAPLEEKIKKNQDKIAVLEAKKAATKSSGKLERINASLAACSYHITMAQQKIKGINETYSFEGKLKFHQLELKELERELVSDTVKYKKMSQDEIYQRVTNAAEILGITQYLTRKPRALSGGQRQRVAIGRAMVRDSKVFLMDEPLSNLDAKLRNQMRAEIILLRKKINTTFIYVTHDQTEAMTLGDRIVIMKDGFIMQVGSPEEVFDRPDNLFVAEFIGAPKMNTFKCELKESKGKYTVHPFGAKIELTGDRAANLKANGVKSKEVILGVRPEHVSVAKGKAENTIPVTIQVNEMMGSELHLHVTTKEGNELIVRVPTVSLTAKEREEMVPGNKLFITFESKVIQLFDPETEISLLKK